MSSHQLVSVKIDEKGGVCHIFESKIRQRLSNPNPYLAAECKERLKKMYMLYNSDWKKIKNSLAICPSSFEFDACYKCNLL